MDQDSGYLELLKDLNDSIMEQERIDGKHSPNSVSDLSSTASAASMDSPNSSSSITSISLRTPPPAQIFGRRRTDDLCETLQNHMFIQNVIPEERPSSLALRSSQSSLSSGSLTTTHGNPMRTAEQGHLEKLTQNLKEIDDFISVTEEILKRDHQRDEEFYAREKQRKLRQLSHPASRQNSVRKSSSLRRKFSMIERVQREPSADEGDDPLVKHSKLRQTRSTDGAPASMIIGNSSGYTNPAQFLGKQRSLSSN